MTFEENARLKAVALAKTTGLPALADDSGLAVDVLGGARGIFSARWAGSHGNDRANLELLLDQLADVKDEHRGAAFVCAAVLALPDGTVRATEGRMPGTLAREPKAPTVLATTRSSSSRGTPGTSAELTPEEKNAISPGQGLSRDGAAPARALRLTPTSVPRLSPAVPEPVEIGGLALQAAGRLHHHGALRPHDGCQGVEVDEAGADVGVPVRPGAELVPAVVAVHEVDASGDRAHMVDHGGEVVLPRARGRCRGRSRRSRSLRQPRWHPRGGRCGRSGGPWRCRPRRCSRSAGAPRSVASTALRQLSKPFSGSSALLTWPPWTMSPLAPMDAAASMLLQQLAAGDADPVVRGRHVDEVGAWTYRSMPASTAAARRASGAAGVLELRPLVPLRVAEEELGQGGPAFDGGRDGVGLVDVGAECWCCHAPETKPERRQEQRGRSRCGRPAAAQGRGWGAAGQRGRPRPRCQYSGRRAQVVELADTQDLGSCAFGCAGSSPALRTHPSERFSASSASSRHPPLRAVRSASSLPLASAG